MIFGYYFVLKLILLLSFGNLLFYELVVQQNRVQYYKLLVFIIGANNINWSLV